VGYIWNTNKLDKHKLKIKSISQKWDMYKNKNTTNSTSTTSNPKMLVVRYTDMRWNKIKPKAQLKFENISQKWDIGLDPIKNSKDTELNLRIIEQTKYNSKMLVVRSGIFELSSNVREHTNTQT